MLATRAGMITLSYDCLVTGLPEHPDPLVEVQIPDSVEVLHRFVTMLRFGSFGSRFSKVVGVGHSIGRNATEAAISNYPSDFDAIIHTGYAYENAAGVGSVVATRLGSPKNVDHLKHLPDGYLVPKSAETSHLLLQVSQFRPPRVGCVYRRGLKLRQAANDSSLTNGRAIADRVNERDAHPAQQLFLGQLDCHKQLPLTSTGDPRRA